MPTPEERLAPYVAKRDFQVTSEPRGGDAPAPGHRFVVQRHRARQLHYDLRLEMDGVLASWAVPKGPTLDSAVKRMAVHVEDHPVEYFDFEGVIPRGEYGSGDVIVWDWGTWAPVRPDEDPVAAVARGEVHFELRGEKLQGRFALIQRGKDPDQRQWLLIHKRDEVAVAGWDPEQHPRSVRSGRTNDEVAAAPTGTWTRSIATVAPWARRLTFDGVTPDELSRFEHLGPDAAWQVGGHSVELTDLDSAVVAGRGRGRAVTKRDVIRYYATAGPRILPYLAGRSLRVLLDGLPPWLPGSDGHPIVENVAALVWVANAGVVDLEPSTARVDAADQPTWALVAIAGGTRTSFAAVRELAALFHAALDYVEIAGRPVVAGNGDIELWIPISGYSFNDTQEWVEKLAQSVGAATPELMNDGTRIVFAPALAAPFSVRSFRGAPVSVPVEWDELDDDRLRPDRRTTSGVDNWIATTPDPLRDLVGLQQQLPPL